MKNDLTLAEQFEDFEFYLESKNCSMQTITSYRSDFRGFMRYLEDKGIDPYVSEVNDPKVLRDYPKWLKHDNKAPSTISRKTNSLRSFFNYMEDEGVIEVNHARKIPAQRKEGRNNT